MKIKVTDKSCGLKAGKEYDLAEMSAKGLIGKGQAVPVAEKIKAKAQAAVTPTVTPAIKPKNEDKMKGK